MKAFAFAALGLIGLPRTRVLFATAKARPFAMLCRIARGEFGKVRLEGGRSARGLREGSIAARVMECVRSQSGHTLMAHEVQSMTGISRELVATALNELLHREEIERTNEEPPYLYRVARRTTKGA